MLRRSWHWAKVGLRLMRRIPAWWSRDYADFRLILEQHGQLHYFCIPSRIQKRMVQAGLLMASAVLLVLGGLALTSLRLALVKSRLEHSHLAVHAALLGYPPGVAAHGASLLGRTSEMVALVKAIQERQVALRQVVGMSLQSFSAQNRDLLASLQATGLTEQAIRTIERASAHGGPLAEPALSNLPQDLLPPSLVQEILQNRTLLETLRALPLQVPVPTWELSSDFGIRKHPVTGVVHFHTGVDLTPVGGADRIYPAKAGQVTAAQSHPQLGNMVVVTHSHGIETLYAHLDRITVTPGQEVSPDTLLGHMGSTGLSTGKHLHFEVLIGGYPVNPLKVIKAARHVQQIPFPGPQGQRS